MHPNNKHNVPYNFTKLTAAVPALAEYVLTNDYHQKTIDFSNQKAVLLLNKALLKVHYNVSYWELPEGHLCPPIPGRADYILHLADFLDTKNVKAFDLGTGANCIYPLLAASLFQWNVVGVDIYQASVISAKEIVAGNTFLAPFIEIRQQTDPAHLFKGMMRENEAFDVVICNPPFYASEKEATLANTRKNTNLGLSNGQRNFAGVSHELWCNGGEALFLKRMIKQSAQCKHQVKWFTSLVSRKENLAKIYKQLDKLKATHTTVPMEQGQKKSRFIAWTFEDQL